jgi:RNA polymerase sigma factor (sigma-70 family)
MDACEDRELVSKAARGDVESFSELVKKYSNAVYATALSVIRDFHIAQDIAQEAFVKAWFNLSDLEEMDKFGGWLLTITKRLCLDWIRKVKPVDPIESFPNLTNRENVEEIVYRRLMQVEVLDAINQLDEPKRLVTIMYYISGFSTKEISHFLNISISAVESRIRRSKEKLKKELIGIMEKEFAMKKMGEEFHEEVMWRIVPRIATIEIPVSNIRRSVEWYCRILGTKVVFESTDSAMLHLQGASRIGVPTLYLVQTDDYKNKISFLNTNTNIIHSVIDFYVPDLVKFHQFLSDQGVEVGTLNFNLGMEGKGGFGFKDPDGHLFSACNVTHQGQE